MLKQVVVLAGGRGTRLGSLTDATPKPLLPVGGTPFLDLLLRNIARFGFSDILLLVGYHGDQIERRYHGQSILSARVSCIREPELLGTAGALRFAAERLDDQFVMLNGDCLFDINLLGLAPLETPPSWLGKIALRRVDNASRYGAVELEGDRIAAFRDRGAAAPGLINGGIYLLKKSIVDEIGPGVVLLERDIFPRLARDGRLFGACFDGFFLDIGIPADHARAQSEIPVAMQRRAVFFDRDGVLNADKNYVHRYEDLEWIPGAIDAVRYCNERNVYTFVVTNQAGVARGYYDENAVHALHARMNEDLRRQGAHIDAFFHCPHHPSGVVAGFARACDCRKPAPGMLLHAMTQWPVIRDGSFLIGDKDGDVAAARAAGIQGYLFEGGNLLEFVKMRFAARA